MKDLSLTANIWQMIKHTDEGSSAGPAAPKQDESGARKRIRPAHLMSEQGLRVSVLLPND
jgi:hypothetical protein